MTSDKIAQFRRTIVGLFNLSSEPFEHLLGPVTEKLHQNIVFIFEIKIDRPVSHPGFFGDLGNGWLMKTLAGKYLYGRFQNQVIFTIFIILIDIDPLLDMTSQLYEWMFIHIIETESSCQALIEYFSNLI